LNYGPDIAAFLFIPSTSGWTIGIIHGRESSPLEGFTARIVDDKEGSLVGIASSRYVRENQEGNNTRCRTHSGLTLLHGCGLYSFMKKPGVISEECRNSTDPETKK
jgi:hypothetical protein